MASRLWSTAGSWARSRPVENQKAPLATVLSSRNMTVTRTGAILPKPVKGVGYLFSPWMLRDFFYFKMPFGLIRVFAIVIPFLYVGTQISKSFAALLEEHDIFVPEDDDDDD